MILTTPFLPYFSRNLHSGRSEADSAEMRRATLRIHHEASHPSRLVLPVVEPGP